MSIYLNGVRKWTLFNETARNLISDYCTTLVLVFWSLIGHLYLQAIKTPGHRIPTLYVPDKFETTSGTKCNRTLPPSLTLTLDLALTLTLILNPSPNIN